LKGDVWLIDRVLVTGGAGFIGSHLVDKLMDEGFEVVVLDDFSSGRRENLNQHFGKANFCLVEGDVRDSVDFAVKNPILVNEVNVGGTLNVLWESLNAGVKRFVYASSCAVYGEPVDLPVNEVMGFRSLLLSIIVGFFMRSMGLRLFV